MAVILAPLFFNANTYRIFDPDKIALVQVCVSVMAVAWVVKWLDQYRRNTLSFRIVFASPLVLPTFGIVLAQLLTTITTIAPVVSFSGAFFRPQGTFVVLTFIALFAMTAEGMKSRQQLDRLIATLALTSLPIALYGIIQNFGADPLVWDREIPGRVFATLGNPIFLGAYLIVVFFLTLGRAVESLRQVIAGPASTPRNGLALRAGIYGLIAFVQILGILFTISRGPWVGWLIGFFFFVLLFALALRWHRLAKGWLGLGLIGIVVVAVLNLPNTPLEPIRSAPYIGSLGHIFEGESGTGGYRTSVWEAHARMFSERPVAQFPDGTPDRLHLIRPLVGYGPDSMSVIFTQFRLADGGVELTKEDRSHNETWDILVNTGILGLAAFQWLWLTIFLLGLKWLGLAPTNRERNLFIGLWFGGGLGLGLATIVLGQFKYFGVALPMGNLAGVALFLIGAAWRLKSSSPVQDPTRQILIAALLAAFVAHYVEIQFGINLAATRVLFWIATAMLVAIGSKQLDTSSRATQPSIPEWIGTASSYALVGATILVTLLFEFMQRTNDADLWQTLWLSLTFNSISHQVSYAILFLILGSWVTIVILAINEMTCAGIAGRGNWRKACAIVGAGSLGLSALFGFGFSAQVSGLTTIPEKLTNPQDGIRVAEQFVGLADFFFVSFFVILLLTIGALIIEAKWNTFAWAINRWALIGFGPLMLAIVVASNAIFFSPIRADVYNKVGLFFTNAHEVDTAIGLFNRAIQLAPMEDRYYMLLGNVYANKAFYLDMKNPSQFGDQTRIADMLNADAPQIAALNRNDAIYAAQTMYLRAYNLNPLYVDHSVNFARLYKPEPPINTPGKIKLAELSSKYYAQAVRLGPNDVRLWNEWADFDLTYLEDSTAALTKLQESARRDPQFAPTFVQMGDIYKAKSNLDQAVAAYERALAAQPQLAEAQSKLAFAYYQQGRLADAIKAYQRFIEIAPSDEKIWEAHKNLALLYKQAGDLAAAIREAERAANLATGDTQAQLNELIRQWRAQMPTSQ